MAAADYILADRKPETGAFPVQAGDKVNVTLAANPDTEAKAAADAANVTKAAYIAYSTALNAYQARADIETLADRRTRANATTFAAADFMRAEVYDVTTGAVKTPPRAGTVAGNADKSA